MKRMTLQIHIRQSTRILYHLIVWPLFVIRQCLIDKFGIKSGFNTEKGMPFTIYYCKAKTNNKSKYHFAVHAHEWGAFIPKRRSLSTATAVVSICNIWMACDRWKVFLFVRRECNRAGRGDRRDICLSILMFFR